MADPTVDELIRIELPPKTPRLSNSGTGHRFGIRGSGTSRGSHSHLAKTKMPLFRPGMLNYLSKAAHPLLSHTHKSKHVSTSSAANLHLQSPVLTSRAKWFSDLSEKSVRKETGISHNTSTKRESDLGNAFSPPIQLMNFPQMKYSEERTQQIPPTLKPPPSESIPFASDAVQMNSNFTGSRFSLGSDKQRSLSPTDWQQQYTQQQLSVPLMSTLQHLMPSANVNAKSFSAFSGVLTPKRLTADGPTQSMIGFQSHHPTTLFKNPSRASQIDLPGTGTHQSGNFDSSSRSTPLIHAFTNLLSSGLDIYYYNQILSTILHPSLVSNSLTASAIGTTDKSSQLSAELIQCPMAWSTANNSKPATLKDSSFMSPTSVVNTLFMPRLSVTDSNVPTYGTSFVDESWIRSDSSSHQTEQNQAKLLNLCTHPAISRLGDGSVWNRPTPLNQTRNSPHSTAAGSPRIKPKEWGIHSEVMRSCLHPERNSTEQVARMRVEHSKSSPDCARHSTEQKWTKGEFPLT